MNSVYEGIYEASWNSDINDLYDKNFVSSYYNHSTEYFSLDYIVSPVKNVFTNPNNIYVGYYNKKLQSVQYIYDDSLVYLKLQTELNKELQEVGKYRKINETTEAFLWCNSKKSDIYIVLYKIATDDKNNVILAIADKKLIKEELNMKQNYNLPTSICYREET